jgi:predicted transcriptional regulator of viral defense system
VTKSAHPDALSKIDVGTAATWRAAGLSNGQLKTLVRAGELVRIQYGLYATRSILRAAESDTGLRHALEVAAVTGRSRRGVASHQSAALIYMLDLLHKPKRGTVTLTVPPGGRGGPYAQAHVVRHAAQLPEEHVTRLYGQTVTTAARTVVDIARAATFMEGVVVADSALHQRHASKTDLRRVLARCERWPGIDQARRVVGFADTLAESVLESCARVFFHEQALPAPVLQMNIIGPAGYFIARTDFCWEQYWTIAEADGLLKYKDRADAIAELKRDRLLREAGYEVVHFTWQELFGEPARVAARIRAAFGRAIHLDR